MHDGHIELVAGAILALLAALVPGCGPVAETSIGQQLRTGAGVAAKHLCSFVFVSGFEPERARSSYIDPILGEGASVIRTEVDAGAQAVVARVPGVLHQTAVHREGYGCTLVVDERRGLGPISRASRPSRAMAVDPRRRDEAFEPVKLQAAVDRAFEQDPGEPPVNTLAVVVLHEGSLVAERYADGVGPDTRLPGWSMAKSVVATLVGVLVHQGRLDVRSPGAVREWRGSSDPRAGITLDQLLRMTSGLAIRETADRGDGRDPSSLMLYHEADAARFAATRDLVHDPGSHFEYMSGSFVLAMRAAQDAIGETLEETTDFVHQNLFGPLGMHSAVMEADQAGTLLGSSHMLATARDWARLGQLQLDRGSVGGRRVFGEPWLRYVTSPTPASLPGVRGPGFWQPGRAAYGAGFWLFGSGQGGGLPADGFDANGFHGQHLHVIPSQGLVVVRLGATSSRDYDHDALPRAVIDALKR